MKKSLIGMVAAMLVLAGCSQEESAPQASADIDLWRDALPVADPWLRDHLPDDSLIYLRVPQAIGMITMPKGNALDPALRSRANVANVIAIQQGLIDNVLSEIPGLDDPAVRAWLSHVRSPVEVSAVFIPAPAALIAVTTDLDSDEAFDALLGELGFSLAEPLDDNDVGQVAGGPAPIMVRFDAGTGRLLINAGPGVQPATFANVIESLDRDGPHPMRKLEARIDESGQGAFFWMDPQKAIPMMQMSVPREQFDRMMSMGLDRATGLALGWGVAGGKGRLSIHVDIPTEQERGFVPYVTNSVEARSVGEPDFVLLLSMPTAEEFARLEALVLETLPPLTQNEWKSAKNDVERASGVSIEEFFTAIGPEIVGIFDRAGDYLAIRIRDAALWDSILDRVAQNTDIELENREIGGETIYHMYVASEPEELETGEPVPWYSEILLRERDHLYWIHDDGYLYLATVPQVFYDRAALGADIDVGDWMLARQGIDSTNTILSINGSSHKLTRRLYAMYIELIQAAGDIALVDVDIWSMPSADQVGLPLKGTMGFTLNLGNPTLSAELTFETNPAELVGSMTGVAALGVTAAIAIPAYQDYTTRAQVASGLALAGATKAELTGYYVDNGAFPGSRHTEAMTIGPGTVDDVQLLSVEPFTGLIVIDYAPSVAGTGGQLLLRPTVEPDGVISWSCSGTFQDKHLPAACRE